MTSKQRAYLKGLAMTEADVLQIGKAGVTDELIRSVEEAIEARELIKMHVLQNCLFDLKEMAQLLAQETRSEVVQVIGRKIVLFRQKPKDSKITLPRSRK